MSALSTRDTTVMAVGFGLIVLLIAQMDWRSSESGVAAAPEGWDNGAKEVAQRYFDVWNAHDSAALEEFFTPRGELRDWDIHVHGAHEVAAASDAVPVGTATVERSTHYRNVNKRVICIAPAYI